MARWGPQVRPNPGSNTRLGHEEGAPVSEAEAASIALILDQEVRSSSRSLMNPNQHRGSNHPTRVR
jgi:hypothetical protein